MTEAEVSRWADGHLGDLRILAGCLRDARDTALPLGRRLEEAEAEVERVRARLTQAQRHLKQELEKQQADTVQLEVSLHEAQRCVTATEARLHEERRGRPAPDGRSSGSRTLRRL